MRGATGKERDVRVPSLKNGGMRAALERRNGGGGDARSTPEEGRVEGPRSLWRRRMRVPPQPPEKGRIEGSRAPEGRTEGCVFPAKEERTEGYGERKARDAVPYWGKAALSPRTNGGMRVPVPARDARSLLRAGVLSREHESLPSFFPPFHPFHHFLCVFRVYSSLFPQILAESKALQVTIYINRQVFLAVILFRER